MNKTVDPLVADLKVLVVDDNLEVCRLIKSTLQDLGVQRISIVSSGGEALKLLGAPEKHGAFDTILCDWNMPGLSGLDLLKHVRSHDPQLPFIMITGNADAEFVAAAKKHGVTAYITKPFAPATLHKKISVVAQMLAKRQVKVGAN
jgi:two-component system chemotaxis response regulator CheY